MANKKKTEKLSQMLVAFGVLLMIGLNNVVRFIENITGYKDVALTWLLAFGLAYVIIKHNQIAKMLAGKLK